MGIFIPHYVGYLNTSIAPVIAFRLLFYRKAPAGTVGKA